MTPEAMELSVLFTLFALALGLFAIFVILGCPSLPARSNATDTDPCTTTATLPDHRRSAGATPAAWHRSRD